MKLAVDPAKNYYFFNLTDKADQGMALILKGEEFVTTEALSAKILLGLMRFARHRPLLLNGVELHAEDLARLVEEAQMSGRPVWPSASMKRAAHRS